MNTCCSQMNDRKEPLLFYQIFADTNQGSKQQVLGGKGAGGQKMPILREIIFEQRLCTELK